MRATLLISRTLVAFAVFGFTWLNIAYGASFVPASPTVQDIVDAWRVRQARVRTMRLEWSDSRTTAAYTQLGNSEEGEMLFPPADVIHEVCVAMSIDGGMLRYSVRGPRWSPDQGEFLPKRYLNVFDGEVSKTFFGYAAEKEDRFFPRGFVNNKEERVFDSGNPHLVAVVLTYRPLHPDLGKFDPAGYRISLKRGVTAGRDCLILQPSGSAVRSESYWIDPQRDYVVLRVVRAVKKRPVMQFDVSYTEDALHRWVPSEWEYVALDYGSGRMLCQSVAKVIKYEINCNIPRSEFRFEFPPGTRVTNRNTGEYYIVRQGGRKRMITMEEVRGEATYEEMVTTESGQALAQRSRGHFWWPYSLGGIAALVLAVAVYTWCRRGAR